MWWRRRWMLRGPLFLHLSCKVWEREIEGWINNVDHGCSDVQSLSVARSESHQFRSLSESGAAATEPWIDWQGDEPRRNKGRGASFYMRKVWVWCWGLFLYSRPAQTQAASGQISSALINTRRKTDTQAALWFPLLYDLNLTFHVDWVGSNCNLQ